MQNFNNRIKRVAKLLEAKTPEVIIPIFDTLLDNEKIYNDSHYLDDLNLPEERKQRLRQRAEDFFKSEALTPCKT
jgi:hypothetical protein